VNRLTFLRRFQASSDRFHATLSRFVQPPFTGAFVHTHPMAALSTFLTALVLALLPAAPADAADASPYPAAHVVVHAGTCLTKSEQRAAVASHHAIPLGQAIKILREHGKRAEVVRARLCRHEGKLVYMLTLLAHNGKVIRTSVDAGNGELLVNKR
jgi:hypothetical protein